MQTTFRKFIVGTLITSTVLLSPGALVLADHTTEHTIQQLSAQIAALQAQLAALIAQMGQQPMGLILTKNLRFGMREAQVTTLQQGLKSMPDVYPEGLVTGYFGNLTFRAVIRFQEKFAAEILAPWGLTRGTGFVGTTTRAKFNALFGGPFPTPTPTVTPTPTATPAPAGLLTVTLSPNNPAGRTLVADSTSSDGAEANAEVLRMHFSAGSGAAIKVTQLRIHRIGISSDSDFSNAYLFEGDTRLAESPSVSGGFFTFINAAGLFEVPNGGSKDISFRVDLANGAGSGLTAQFGIMNPSDVVSNAASLSLATFHGNEFRTASVADLGKLTLTSVSPSTNNSIEAGVTSQEVWRFTARADDEKIGISKIKFTMIGTADFDALQNLKLFVDGTQVGQTIATMGSDKTLTFDFSPNIEIQSGVTKTLSLRADIVKGSGRNFFFQIASGGDILAKDLNYNVFIKVNQSNVWSVFKAAGTTTISEGALTVTKASESPTGPLALNATNMEVATYDIKATGEAIKISKITVIVDDDDTVGSGFTNLKNVKATVNGTQIGTTAASVATDGSGQDFSAGNTFVVEAGTTAKLSIFADIASASGAADALAAGDKFEIELDIAAADVTRMSSGTTFSTAPADNLAGNTIQVVSGALTVTRNPSVANVSTVLGGSGVTIGSWLITAPSEQGLNVNSITIEDNGNSEGLGAAFANVRLTSNGTQFGQTISSPSSTAGTDLVFSFSTSLQVPAGQSKQINLIADVLSSASTSVWNGGSTDAARVIDVSSTGLVTNSAVTYASGNVAGQLITISGGATLTLENAASPTMPDSQHLVTGDTNQTLAAWRLAANNTEDVRVTRIKVFEVGSSDNEGNLKNLKLFVDGVQVGATVSAFTSSSATSSVDAATLDEAVFEDANGLFTITRNSSRTVTFRADITDDTNATFVTTGSVQRVRLEITDGAATATTNVSARGVTSGTLVTLESGASATNALNSNNMKVVKTQPTFALVSPSSTTLIPAADQEVYRFRITAHANEDGKFVSGTSNIRFTMSGSPTTATAYDFKLFDASTNTQLGSTIAIATASGGTVDFTAFNLTIPKGTTRELYVLASLNNFSSIGNTFRLSINNTASDLSWSDNSSASADISSDNYVDLGLPLNGPTFVKP